jgi:hypothetical protein
MNEQRVRNTKRTDMDGDQGAVEEIADANDDGVALDLHKGAADNDETYEVLLLDECRDHDRRHYLVDRGD